MKRIIKRLAAPLAVGLMAVGLTACAGPTVASQPPPAVDGETQTDGDRKTVGIALPNQIQERWVQDGDSLQEGLEAAGFDVMLQFANEDVPTQQQQIEQMITLGVDVMLIAPVDGSTLSTQLDSAASAGIPVISYDRLIRDSEHVDFYVTFDNFNVGAKQGEALLQGLGVLDAEGNETGETGPFTIELFAGSIDDNNSHFFWNGAMSVLEPFIDNGTLVVGSGQTELEVTAIQGWQPEAAQRRMEDLITSVYGGGTGRLVGVLSPNDSFARAIINALQNAGFGPTIADGLPIVTGQDAEIASIRLIDDGVQFATVLKDTRILAERSVEVVQAILAGETPQANDTESYHNGVKIVPAYLVDIVTVTTDNIQSAIIDSGFFTADQVARGQL